MLAIRTRSYEAFPTCQAQSAGIIPASARLERVPQAVALRALSRASTRRTEKRLPLLDTNTWQLPCLRASMSRTWSGDTHSQE